MRLKTGFTILLLHWCIFSHTSAVAEVSFTEAEKQQIISLALDQLPKPIDPSNQYLNNPTAIQLGEKLFNDNNLSSNKLVSCATCHISEKAFTDNKTIAFGQRKGFRNTPSILNSAQHNWLFADGSKDSLWAQAIMSIENPAEQNFTRVELLHYLVSKPSYKSLYKQIFKQDLEKQLSLQAFPKAAGPNSKLENMITWKKMAKGQRDITNKVITNVGKAIAAYVSSLRSEKTRFDNFVEELKEKGTSRVLTDTEQRGLKLYLSQKSGCINCHNSAFFSNKEFHNIATGIPGKDNGRSEILDAVRLDEFNCLGEYSDAKREDCLELRYMKTNKHALSGAYKTPSLRNISKTSPYMHDGRYKSLQEVLEHYNNIDVDNAKEVGLAPIDLNKDDQNAIVEFLMTI